MVKREFVKKVGLISATGMLAAVPSANGQKIHAGAVSNVGSVILKRMSEIHK